MLPGRVYLLSFAYPSADDVRGFLETRDDFWAIESYSGTFSFVLGAGDIKTETPPSWDLFAGIEEGGLWVEVLNQRGEEILVAMLQAIPQWFGEVTVGKPPASPS